MPQAATLPRPSHTRRTVRVVPLEERVAVLETHAQQIATKADISDLRSEILKWGVGAVVALSAVFFALLAASTARTDATLADIKADQRAMNARIERLDEKIDSRFDALLSRQDKLDAKFDAVLAELRSQRRNAE